MKNGKAVVPYCAVENLMQAFELIRRRVRLEKIDIELLESHQIAPGNEYKVINALSFLALIDEEGRPTEKSRLLRVKGPSGFRKIVGDAYPELFQKLATAKPSFDNIYNYFIAEKNLTPEMARKATSVFIYLCQMAEILELGKTRIRKIPPRKRPQLVNISILFRPEEVMNMEVDELAQLFRKVRETNQ